MDSRSNGPRLSALSFWCATALAVATTAASAGEAMRREEGTLRSGASYVIEIPAKWNKTLLLFSHGYNPGPANPATVATKDTEEVLLQQGYALAGSSYATTGWAIADAVQDQLAALEKFDNRFGKPKYTIAWGASMGGLITVALVEQHPERIAGGLPMCGSVGGALGMMNGALDAAFVLNLLVPTAVPLRIVNVAAPAAGEVLDETREVKALIDAALASPAGRARGTLAAALAQVPPWTDPKRPEPEAGDFDIRQANMINALPFGAFFPRSDIEHRAGGNVSWNSNIDYALQLTKSGQRALVEEAYRRAGLSLEQDLATLAAAPRVGIDAAAASYLLANYTPSGKLQRPTLSLHTSDDPLTTVSHESSFENAVKAAGREKFLRVAITHQAGHCNFTQPEIMSAIAALRYRVENGRWSLATPDALNRSVTRLGGKATFIPLRAPPMVRECSAETCPGLRP